MHLYDCFSIEQHRDQTFLKKAEVPNGKPPVIFWNLEASDLLMGYIAEVHW